MRYLGIDFGTKRIGLALSNEEGTFAFPHSVVPNSSQALVVIEKVVRDEKVAAVVVGESFDYKGVANPVMEQITRFKNALEKKLSLPVFFEREGMSTREASHLQGEHEKIDASAAAIILKSYLDKQRA